uniref:GAG-pre-integrase domain-containing protein n=1 Tax=Tanacetum cinerariifolium TaxID=118510 RepID=A0A6L2KP44_TANCI|nr:hypothetical protein [Tanacetum cinerariifolium]
MNYVLQAVPNEIYNSLDACENAKEMWKRIKVSCKSFISNSPQPYYVTHPSSVVDYEEDYQGELHVDSQEDKLTTAMMLLARAITQKFSTPTNNRVFTLSNTRNQAMIQDGVESSNSVRKPKSKDNKSKNRVLKNTNDKRSSVHARKVSSSVRLDSNNRETMNLTICQSNASVLTTKIINAVNDGSNIVCFSCVRFGNDHFATIIRYGDYVQGNLTGDDLLTGSRESNVYTISIFELADSSSVCLMSKATSTKSWLWHCRLSHLNFEYYAPSTSEVSNNSIENTFDVDNTSLPSSIIVEDSDASQIVTSSEEPITQDSSTPVLKTQSNEQIHDVTKLDGNTIMHSLKFLEFGEVGSSLNFQDPSNMHEFHQ